MGQFGSEWGFFAGGIAAFSATATFFGVLSWNEGTQAVREW
ncbi:hypothetical protein ACERIT_00985 [Halopenitus sp. H-Gu1]